MVRGKLAEHAYQGAQGAVTAFKKTGDFEGTIGRYNLIPYNGQLMTPEAFKRFWEQQTAAYRQQGYGGYFGAAIPRSSTTVPSNVLAELEQYYNQQA